MAGPSWIEISLLAVLICTSVFLFWMRFRVVVHEIRKAKAEPGYRFAPVVPRVRQFVWEVLLQGKVIRERPLPGIAHAFVFWGFCAFALVTINHLAAGFSLMLISRESLFGKI